MKKTGWILFFISLIINGLMLWFFFFRGDVIEVKNQRRAVMLSENHREIVMGEMRKFLENIHEINQGILEDNPERIIKAARASGRRIDDEVPQGLIKSIPLDFKQMGFRAHDLFDEIADGVEVNYNKKSVQNQLGTLLNQCITCHQVYQIKIKDNK